MATASVRRATAIFFIFPLTARALQVSPGSKCAERCLNSGSDNEWAASDSNTNITDITCSDSSYLDTAVGQHYQRCLSCLERSNRAWDGETDQKWFIYNLRYTLGACLFATPSQPSDNSSFPCATNDACRSLKHSLTSDNLEPNPDNALEYCAADNGTFMSASQSSCRDCLRNSNDQAYMANFITALEAGCRQALNDGDILGLNATVFSKSPVEIISPEPVKNTDGPTSSLPPPAIAGIVVGVILVLLLAACLLMTQCRRKRRRNTWNDLYDEDNGPAQRSPYHCSPSSTTAHGASERHFIRSYHGDQTYAGSRTTSEKTTPVDAAAAAAAHFTGRCGRRPQNGIELCISPVHHEHGLEAGGQSSAVSPTPTNRGKSPLSPSQVREGSFSQHAGNMPPKSPPPLPSPTMPNRPPRRHDSFAEQAYLSAAEEIERIARRQRTLTPTHSSPKTGATGKLASILSSSLAGKLKVPPGGFSFHRSSSSSGQHLRGTNISAPILGPDPRFAAAARGPAAVVDPGRQQPVVPRARNYAVVNRRSLF